MPWRRCWVGLLESLTLGAEVVGAEGLEAARHRAGALVFPPLDVLLDVLGEGAVEVVRGVVLADVGDGGVNRHEHPPPTQD